MSDVILFDLDGTLTDSGPGITKCVQYALNYMGKPEKDLDKLRCFVGPPLHEQFMSYCGFTSEEADTAVEQYRERYATLGLYENSVYDRIPEVLQLLKDNDKVLGVASSKPVIFVEEILAHFNLREYFSVVVGSELDGTRTAKDEVIEEALKRLGYEGRRERVLMVGDREHDVKGAQKCGIQCVGVAYGYGGREELESAGAAYIADTVEDLGILAEADDEGDEKVSRFKARKEKKAKAQKAREQMDRDMNSREQNVRDARGQMRDGKSRVKGADMKKKPLTPKDIGWMLWDIFLPVLFHYACLIGVTFAGVFLAGLLLMGQSNDYMGVIQTYPWLSSVFTGVASLIIIYFLGRVYQREKVRLSIVTKQWNAKLAVVCILTAIGVGQLLNKAILSSGLRQMFQKYTEISENSFENQNLLVLVMCIGVLGSLAEEIVFRGLVYTRTKSYLGVGWGLVLSAVTFGVYHGNVLQFIYALLMGFMFALIYEKTGNLLAPVFAHIAANVWAIFSDRIFDYAIKLTSYGELILLLLMGVLALGGIWYLFIRKEPAYQEKKAENKSQSEEEVVVEADDNSSETVKTETENDLENPTEVESAESAELEAAEESAESAELEAAEESSESAENETEAETSEGAVSEAEAETSENTSYETPADNADEKKTEK